MASGRRMSRTVRVGTLLFAFTTPVVSAQRPASEVVDPSVFMSPRDSTAGRPVVAFQDVTVVDVRSGERRPGRTVVVVGNRIQTVGGRGTAIPAGARIVKAPGAYLIPGLWDMHVHVWEKAATAYPLFIANGVTGVREMHTPFLDSVLQWRHAIASGAKVGPRVVTAGPFLAPPQEAAHSNAGIAPPGFPFVVGVATPADGRRIVDSLRKVGVDFIKVRDGLPRHDYFAIAAEARRIGIAVAGHLPESVTPTEASDSGQRSIEHALDCDTHAVPRRHGAAAFDAVGCAALAARFRSNGTWFSPGDAGAGSCHYWVRCGDLMRYSVGDSIDARLQLDRGGEMPAMADIKETDTVDIARLRRAGIRLLASTDAPSSAALPGFALQDYLRFLARGGFTPLEALRAATLSPAEYLSATDSLGTIEPGKLADLVLLDADPLEDIYNTQRIRAVMANGRLFSRADLNALLGEVERLVRYSTGRP